MVPRVCPASDSHIRWTTFGTPKPSRHFLLMREYEIRLFGPSGRIAEVYVMGALCDACALTRACILTSSHKEFISAEVRESERIVDASFGFAPVH
jgi:hypothetical protein